MGFGKRAVMALAALSLLSSVLLPIKALAAVQAPAPTGKVSFTFDDGLTSAVTQAAPTMAKYGLTGTDYVITGCVGMTTAPNTCRANTDNTYMSWDQITQLQNTYGWEIGSHTVDHYCLASTGDGSDCQTNLLTPAQVDYELSQSKATLAAHGFNAIDMSTPYGDYNNAVLANIAKYYESQRGFADLGANSWPYSDYFLHVMQVEGSVTVAQVEQAVNQAIANNQWLVLVMHDIRIKASKNNDNYQWSTANLATLSQYVQSKEAAGLLTAPHISQGLMTSDTNLLPNSSFNDGIADGWSTDAPSSITADSGDNGSYPDPTNSIKMVSSASTEHLFSPEVTVDPNTTYGLKNFLNVQSNSGGTVGFYIDEYNANGNWISGQYKAGENSSFVEEMNFSYKPSSAAVRYARLQVIVTGNSGITAYLDNSQWFPLQTTAPPQQTNLVANGTFDAGLADGWTTDAPSYITADSNNNGSPSDPINSIKLTAGTTNAHLFSPKVAVSSTHSYSLSAWLNLLQINSANGGEVAFYIDEYDSSGNWISGQYKTGIHVTGAGNVPFSYTPSSGNVAQASLQVIVVGNSNILAYLDDVAWYQN